MAAVEITISGVLYDKYNRTQQNVVLIGEAMLTGLSVGGGPMPPGQGGGGGSPPGIWGPTDPRPTPPIYLPGGGGGGQPPGIWGGGNVPMPTPPIYFPPGNGGGGGGGGGQPPGIWGGGNVPMPTPPIHLPPDLPPDTGGEHPRPIDWKVGWTQQTGWIVVGIPQFTHPAPSGT